MGEKTNKGEGGREPEEKKRGGGPAPHRQVNEWNAEGGSQNSAEGVRTKVPPSAPTTLPQGVRKKQGDSPA